MPRRRENNEKNRRSCGWENETQKAHIRAKSPYGCDLASGSLKKRLLKKDVPRSRPENGFRNDF